MKTLSVSLSACELVLAAVSLWAAVSAPARAEKADRSKPMVVEADQSGTIDLQRQVLVYSGNVVISQGTMLLRAERIEMREAPDGYRSASAVGSAAKPATWRQRRDGVDETVEGAADRIEFDGRADTLRLVGNGSMRRLRAGAVVDEVTGATILWDNTAEVAKVESGVVSPVNPTGRVRMILSPLAEQPASAPALAPAALTPSRAIEGRR